MPAVVFPRSTSPGNDKTESAGRLINAYCETLPEGGPAPYVIRRAPGEVVFCTTSESTFRGMWYDGESYVYAAWEDELFYIDEAGTETSVGALAGSRLTLLAHPTDATNLTVYTFVAVALGVAHFNRRILVGVYNVGGVKPTGITVDGIAATEVKDQAGFVTIYIVAVPTGTTGDIVVTYAGATTNCSIGVWRLDGVTSNTAHHTNGQTVAAGSGFSFTLNIPSGGSAIALGFSASTMTWSGSLTEVYADVVEGSSREGASRTSATAFVATVAASGGGPTAWYAAAASWGGSAPGISDYVTFAKNNAVPPDQMLCTPALGTFTFTTSAITVVNVNSEIGNSICFGEGYFFVTMPSGYCYASGLNGITFSSLDRIRAEARAEALVRGVFYDGELYLFGLTHLEVWGSGGNPNASGFPLNRTTVVWRGLLAIGAVCGFEEGFEGGLFWVADDYSVRMLAGYQAQTISPPDLERQIEACADKPNIRAFVYDVGGHACVAIDIAGEDTWIFDLTEKAWFQRNSIDIGHDDHWRVTGNSVRAFGKWLAGDHHTGNILQIDGDTWNATPIIESIAMEAFPSRLQVGKFEANFVAGVGNATVPDPVVLISWSDDGGHKWSNPITRKLGEAGRTKEHVRINRGGLTGSKGRRYRIRCDDESVYFGFLGASMDVAGRPTAGGK